MPRLDPSLSLWATRVLWVATAACAALALDGVGHLAHTDTLAVGLWLVVGALLVGLVVPGCLALTAVRAVVPALLPSAGALAWSAATATTPSTAVTVEATVALVLLAATAAVALSGELGQAMVQASAYGHEQRFPLRPPATTTVAIAVTWTVWTALVTAAVILVAADRLVAAAVVLVVVLVAGAVLWRTYHRFALRWLVLVPAGVVVHDPVVLGETLMVLRPNVVGARLAPADTEAADLTGPAAGFAIEVTIRDAATVLFAADRDHPRGRAIHAHAFLVAPTRPGRALRAIADHRIAVS